MLGRNSQGPRIGQGRIMRKHLKFVALGTLATSVVLGAWFYRPHSGCAARQTEIYLQGIYELVPERAAQSAAVHCFLHANQVDQLRSGL